MSFKRPETLNFPIVYREFSSKKGDSIKFRIQDLPEEYFEEAVELLLKHFMPEETFCVAKKLYDDDEIRNIMIEFYQEILRKKLSIGCFAEGSKDLIAVNIMDVKSEGDEEPEFTNKTLCEIMEVVRFTDSHFNPFKAFNVNAFLTSYALCVHPSYRGFGVATEVLKTRVEMLKALDLKATTTMFTTLGSQIAVKRANFEESWSMSFDEITEKFPTFDFSKASSKFMKKFSLQI